MLGAHGSAFSKFLAISSQRAASTHSQSGRLREHSTLPVQRTRRVATHWSLHRGRTVPALEGQENCMRSSSALHEVKLCTGDWPLADLVKRTIQAEAHIDLRFETELCVPQLHESASARTPLHIFLSSCVGGDARVKGGRGVDQQGDRDARDAVCG